ncbi:MAG: oxidoreductase [Synechococcaceae cyanobacterium]|nr:oxidoreductase [Synechococcaceae cyanobacterium]
MAIQPLRSGRTQLRLLLLLALLPALLVYGGVLLFGKASNVSLQYVLRDLAQTCGQLVGGLPFAVGLVSSLGYLIWMAAAAIALFTAFSEVSGPRGPVRGLLVAGGIFSLILTLDDMFLLHDLYISQHVLYAVYAVFAVLILFRFRPYVVALGGPMFLVAVALLGLSVLADALQEVLPFPYATVQIVEEGAKFLGSAAWLFFWWQASAGAAKLRGMP